MVLCLGEPALAAGAASAQTFPNKPIRLVIGSPPGGGIDLVGRILATRLSENLGQQVIVDNRGGANGIIGMGLVAKAAPDGYTIYMGTAGHVSVNPALYPNMPFNIERDLTPLTQVVTLPFLVYLHPSFPARTLGELISHAKANPGRVTWSSSGNGGLPHLTGALLNLVAGINTRRIPYKGSAPAFNDLLGGQVQYCIEAVSIGLQHVKAGRLLALATTGPARLSILPDVPALKETLPGLEVLNWYGMLLPAGAPREVVTGLHAAIFKAMKMPEIHAKLLDYGFDPIGSTPKEFGALRKSEEVRWARVIREAEIQAYCPEITDLQVARIPRPHRPLTVADLPDYRKSTLATVAPLAKDGADLVIYGCTAAGFLAGPHGDTEAVRALSDLAGAPVVSTAVAMGAALHHSGLHRVDLVSPYIDWKNEILISFLAAAGVTVAGCGSFSAKNPTELGKISAEQVLKKSLDIARDDSQGLFIACVQLPTLDIIPVLTTRLQRPVWSAVRAAAWAARTALSLPAARLAPDFLPDHADATPRGARAEALIG